MRTLELVYNVPDFDKIAEFEADNERRTDFLHDPEGAKLCTAAFCCKELASYISKTDCEVCCVYASVPSGKNPYIVLECVSAVNSDGGYSFIVKGKEQLIIRGNDRSGMVSGSYDFLRLQGWNWIEPGTDGEFAPEPHALIFPEKDQVATPSFKHRAAFFEYPSQASVDYLMWLARNKMNCTFLFPDLTALTMKLGLNLMAGGHIFADMLLPTKKLRSGKTILEEHPEWYGTRKDGAAVTVDNALCTQFCASNPQLIDYLAEELIFRLNNEWKGVDFLKLSLFDTWGGTCHCPKCRELTDTDKVIKTVSALRDRLDKAEKEGKLPRNPVLNFSAYEGTCTILPPTHIPENMAKAQDQCTAWVILRCYMHHMGDLKECPINAGYAKIVRDWCQFNKSTPIWAGEYYNVSRHEDLPLLFTENMSRSMRFYHETGAQGAIHMHIPVLNWSIRGITQNLHAGLGWDVNMDVRAFEDKFLKLRYGKYSSIAKEACRIIEDISKHITDWRAWRYSILGAFESFAVTCKTDIELTRRHYVDNADALKSGRKVVAGYKKAYKLLNSVLDEVLSDVTHKPLTDLAVNPAEQQLFAAGNRIVRFLECDLRMLNYAVDMSTIMLKCAEAYDAMQNNDRAKVEKLTVYLEKLAKRMSLYTESISYRIYTPHTETRTALRRSQCEPFIRTLRKWLAIHK